MLTATTTYIDELRGHAVLALGLTPTGTGKEVEANRFAWDTVYRELAGRCWWRFNETNVALREATLDNLADLTGWAYSYLWPDKGVLFGGAVAPLVPRFIWQGKRRESIKAKLPFETRRSRCAMPVTPFSSSTEAFLCDVEPAADPIVAAAQDLMEEPEKWPDHFRAAFILGLAAKMGPSLRPGDARILKVMQMADLAERTAVASELNQSDLLSHQPEDDADYIAVR